MTPAATDALIARAKSLAIPVASCVAATLRPDHLLKSCTRDELAALVIVLAESADPVRLRAVVAAADDDDLPSPDPRDLVLRRAHAEVWRLRERGEEIPTRLGYLENEYQEGRRLARRARTAAREAAARDLMLKDAHAEVGRLRKANQPVPRELIALDTEYRADRRRRQRECAA